MTFKTINNTTPLFEGTDTHALVGHSSYSTTGTTSFTAIHTDVAGKSVLLSVRLLPQTDHDE